MGVYMSTLSQFVGGGKPKQVTTYTSGTGTYTPSAPNAWCYVTLVGAGGAGAGRGGGSAGAVWQQWVLVAGPTSYAVGAANSGSTTFGSITAVGGNGAGGGGAQVNGQSGQFGSGGTGVDPGSGGSATGYGSGGGSGGSSSQGYQGGNGSGGLIIIQDFGP